MPWSTRVLFKWISKMPRPGANAAILSEIYPDIDKNECNILTFFTKVPHKKLCIFTIFE